jgi:uncharacterized protein (TIGR02001 family)
MKNILLGCLMALSFNSYAVELNGTLGYTSDYVWRGASQGNQPAFSFGAEVTTDTGFYLGAWESDVEFGDTTTETDYYGGYRLDVADNVTADLGYMRYTYNGSTETFEEVYGIVKYHNLSVAYFQNIEDNDNYGEVRYNLWFVPNVDVTVVYGMYTVDDTFWMATIGRALNESFYIKAKIGLAVDAFGMTGNLFEGQLADNVSVGLTYNW